MCMRFLVLFPLSRVGTVGYMGGRVDFTLTFDSSPIKGEGYWLFFVSSSHVCMLSFCLVYVRSI